MDEKIAERIKKLQALAERGVGGEKDTAEKMLKKMLEENGIKSLDEIQDEQCEYTLFSYNGKLEKRLLDQCIYKVLTSAGDKTRYHSKGTRQKIGIYCTRTQKIEIEMEFDFYRKVLSEELDIFMSAFINAQKIFPPDAPKSTVEDPSERDMKVLRMASGIDKKTRTAMIGEAENSKWRNGRRV